jgi:hypothetical protein
MACLLLGLLGWRRHKSKGYIFPWSGFLGYRKNFNDVVHLDSMTAAQLKVN